MADIVLVNPRFETSFWGFEHAMPLFGKKAAMPVGSLPLLAALTPGEHTITLVDECVEEIDYDRLARADIVGVTGMVVQRVRMREILTELKRRGVFTVVGGAWASVQEEYFADLADVIFVGEADESWPQFLEEWKAGRHASRYEQAEKSDMTRVPAPRFDLLDLDAYAFAPVQFTRGCPFQCEFCDIIVTFGRRPRLKTSAQVIAELEALRARGLTNAFVVDDNLIGNKKAVKELLRDVIAWQRKHHYQLGLATEASLDLAEDPELMALMVEANMVNVFVGIESPNEASLKETKKYQNVRKGGTIVERVHTIQRAGLEVWCGMIVGFDNDDPTVFDAQVEFLRQARISTAMVGMLYAVPKTPLHARLAKEGRLDPTDGAEYGTNVVPLRISRAALRDGYVRVMSEVYDPEAFFDRVDDLFLNARIPFFAARARHLRTRPVRRLLKAGRYLTECAVLFARLMRQVPDPALRAVYRKRILRLLRHRPDITLLHHYIVKCAMHYHHYTLARGMAAEGGALVNVSGTTRERTTEPVPV